MKLPIHKKTDYHIFLIQLREKLWELRGSFPVALMDKDMRIKYVHKSLNQLIKMIDNYINTEKMESN